MNHRHDVGADSSALARASADIDRWRSGHDRRRRIPEAFWETAATLAAEHGVHRVATAMRLNSVKLKKRMKTAIPPGFVEVRAATPPRLPKTIAIEAGHDGEHLVRLQGAAETDVARVVTAFLRETS